jgi:hypothetical protein
VPFVHRKNLLLKVNTTKCSTLLAINSGKANYKTCNGRSPATIDVHLSTLFKSIQKATHARSNRFTIVVCSGRLRYRLLSTIKSPLAYDFSIFLLQQTSTRQNPRCTSIAVKQPPRTHDASLSDSSCRPIVGNQLKAPSTPPRHPRHLPMPPAQLQPTTVAQLP